MKAGGELVVVGKDSIEVELRGKPRSVRVEFADELEITPCNPRHFDELEFITFQRRDGMSYLLIKWNVSDIRVIVWEAHYG